MGLETHAVNVDALFLERLDERGNCKRFVIDSPNIVVTIIQFRAWTDIFRCKFEREFEILWTNGGEPEVGAQRPVLIQRFVNYVNYVPGVALAVVVVQFVRSVVSQC